MVSIHKSYARRFSACPLPLTITLVLAHVFRAMPHPQPSHSACAMSTSPLLPAFLRLGSRYCEPYIGDYPICMILENIFLPGTE